MRIKEPFLLTFSVLFILFGMLPKNFYQKRDGTPFQNLGMARIACVAIGLAQLLLWYSLPSN
jgi:hypothetical protein